MAWTDDRVETLKRMWGEGASASQIAKELGGVTRNAVIGKVHRLGLSNRNADDGKADAAAATPVAAKPARAPAPEPVVEPEQPAEAPAVEEEEDDDEPRTMAAVPHGTNVTSLRKPLMAGQPLPPQPSANEISPEALAKVNAVEKTAKKISLMELTERTCKWPIGDPATEKFWFCGLQTQTGKPYCEAHVSVAFQPMSSRRDRKR
ncbi:GcrA family cell cycle regulator [Jannaschia rubra]|uniref:GcrA cell cycle regulator n=1 Tax=Jannaschia rubra TaxID=282197 RepID=A0A0M6XUA1_9RHOB|nr:GcrA family cell cycle regulator [Jannaschia rubra]CTQ33791.1 GcrA cell cycle regulator [Jannaschia rubra]SFG09142.1 GcrA cell cycle regulator [Jannaschia rubra]